MRSLKERHPNLNLSYLTSIRDKRNKRLNKKERHCKRCGCVLRQSNKDKYCSPCNWKIKYDELCLKKPK